MIELRCTYGPGTDRVRANCFDITRTQGATAYLELLRARIAALYAGSSMHLYVELNSTFVDNRGLYTDSIGMFVSTVTYRVLCLYSGASDGNQCWVPGHDAAVIFEPITQEKFSSWFNSATYGFIDVNGFTSRPVTAPAPPPSQRAKSNKFYTKWWAILSIMCGIGLCVFALACCAYTALRSKGDQSEQPQNLAKPSAAVGSRKNMIGGARFIHTKRDWKQIV